MFDILGNELKIDDKVVFTHGEYNYLKLGVIIGFTNNFVKVRDDNTDQTRRIQVRNIVKIGK